MRRRESLSHQLARRSPAGYIPALITGFAHKGLEDFFYEGSKRGIQPRHAQRLADILDRLDAAQHVSDMRYPGSGLHPLGRWQVTGPSESLGIGE